MMLESKTDQLLASLKPTARPHVDIELVRRGGDRRGVSLSAPSTDTRSNSTQKIDDDSKRSQQWRQVEICTRKSKAMVNIYNLLLQLYDPPRRRQQQQARATDTRNLSPPSIHSFPRHLHRDALLGLHPQFSQICCDYSITAIHSCRSHHQLLDSLPVALWQHYPVHNLPFPRFPPWGLEDSY